MISMPFISSYNLVYSSRRIVEIDPEVVLRDQIPALPLLDLVPRLLGPYTTRLQDEMKIRDEYDELVPRIYRVMRLVDQ